MGMAVIGTAMSVSAADSTVEAAFTDSGAGNLTIDEAVETALTDAGLSKDAVTFSKVMSDYDNGVSVYDIHFMVPEQTKYEYEVDYATGSIIQREQEPWEAEDSFEYEALLTKESPYFDFTLQDVTQAFADAISAATSDMPENSRLYKLGTDYDDGMVLFNIGYLVPGEMKFDYKIDCATGSILGQETDPWEAEDDMEYAALLADVSAENAAADTAAPSGSITEEEARNIALADAGFSESEVTRLESHKDFDDGIEQFDVSFNGPDGREYNYDISVADGRILDKEAEFDD